MAARSSSCGSGEKELGFAHMALSMISENNAESAPTPKQNAREGTLLTVHSTTKFLPY